MREKSLLVSVLAVATLSLGAIACTSGGGDDDGNATIDSGPITPPIDAAPGCSIPSSVTLFDPANPNALAQIFPPQAPATNETYVVKYITGAPGGDAEWFEFDADKPVETGTPLNLSQGCSPTAKFCFIALGNWTDAGGKIDGDVYFGLEGTVTVTAAGELGGQLTASYEGVKFLHAVKNAAGDYVLANDDCDVTVADGSFDLTLKNEQGMKLGSGMSSARPSKYVLAR